MALLGIGKKASIDQFNLKDLRKARIEEEVKYDIYMGVLKTANDRYEGYKRAASQPGRADYEIERAAMEMASWAKKKRSTIKQIREVQAKTRVVDSITLVVESKQELTQHGIWNKLHKMGSEEMVKGTVKIASMLKERDHTYEAISNALDTGVDDVVIEAEKDSDEQKATEEILAMRNSL
jgi:hypothetical protein